MATLETQSTMDISSAVVAQPQAQQVWLKQRLRPIT
jgi:hypothetical protein